MKNYHTWLLKFSSLILFLHLTTTLFGSNLANVKGRTIVLKTPNNGINYELDCFYEPIALEKGFKPKYIYNRTKGNVTPSEDILMRHFFVEDIIFNKKNDEKRGVCLKMRRINDNAIILYRIPPFKRYKVRYGSVAIPAFSQLRTHSYFMAHCGWSEKCEVGPSGRIYTLTPTAIQLCYTDVSNVSDTRDRVDVSEKIRGKSNLEDVKNRTIVLTIPEMTYVFDCFYDPIALEKGFKKKYIYNRAKGNVTPVGDILSRHFYVEDVIYNTSNYETSGVCLKLIRKDDNAEILFYIPPFEEAVVKTGASFIPTTQPAHLYFNSKYRSFFMAHCKWDEKYLNTYIPTSIQLNYIDVDKIAQYENKLKSQHVYIVDNQIRFVELQNITWGYSGVYFSMFMGEDKSDTRVFSLKEILDLSLINKQNFISSCRSKYDNTEILLMKMAYQGQKLRITKPLSTINDSRLCTFYEQCCDNSNQNEAPICYCKGIELEYIKEFNIPEYRYYATFTSESGRVFKLPINSDFNSYFTLDSTYVENQRLKAERDAKRAAEREAKRQQAEQERQREEAEYKAGLVRKYGKYNADLILDGQVRIGFTKEMCRLAWGLPYDINKNINQYGTYEQWCYDIGCYLYFDNDKLTTIQN